MLPKEFPKSALRILNTKANKKAHQKPSTLKPGTNQSQISITRALMTRRKRPNVKTVTGRVRIISTGLSVKLTNIITAARMNPVVKSSKWIPGKKYSAMITQTPPIRILIKKSPALLLELIP